MADDRRERMWAGTGWRPENGLKLPGGSLKEEITGVV